MYRLGIDDIRRGDLVVFWFPQDPSKSYIKRVIGLPGDVVEVDDGDVIEAARDFSRTVTEKDPGLEHHPGLASMVRAALDAERVAYLDKS